MGRKSEGGGEGAGLMELGGQSGYNTVIMRECPQHFSSSKGWGG